MALTSGATLVLQWGVQWVAKAQAGANPTKASHSSDCRLKLAGMKLESLVNAYQLWRVEYVLGSCTHRPSRHESRGYPKTHTFEFKLKGNHKLQNTNNKQISNSNNQKLNFLRFGTLYIVCNLVLEI